MYECMYVCIHTRYIHSAWCGFIRTGTSTCMHARMCVCTYTHTVSLQFSELLRMHICMSTQTYSTHTHTYIIYINTHTHTHTHTHAGRTRRTYFWKMQQGVRRERNADADLPGQVRERHPNHCARGEPCQANL